MRLGDLDALKKAFNKWWGCDDIPATVVEDIIDEAPTVIEADKEKPDVADTEK